MLPVVVNRWGARKDGGHATAEKKKGESARQQGGQRVRTMLGQGEKGRERRGHKGERVT
jgi:hypothetical protein